MTDRIKKDRYGRILGYIYRSPDGLFVNAEIIKQGYGNVYTRGTYKYKDHFLSLEKHARDSQKGIWNK